jgi:hypothetical protein
MQSFSYMHTCVRSHVEQQERETNDGRSMDIVPVKVCDWYEMNGKRWDIDGPVRATIQSIGSRF